MSTEEWVRAAQRGDPEAFHQLVSMERTKLYSIAFAYLKNEADALEAIQETTCRAFLKLGKLKEPRYFHTWFIRILIHYCMDEQKRKRKMLPLFQLPETLAADLALDEKLRLQMAIDKLTPRLRHVIILKYYEDNSAAGETGRHRENVAEQSAERAQGDFPEGGRAGICLMKPCTSRI
ncbi:sigma-70 family RNA polymerase sigma factor [Cohnella candidum]|uniref:sigma-70 family RNA polymerase sigma factor n=1 Tax=Cohnella candidum TaxID=2674991 RepID=UPI0030B9A2D9